MHTDVTLDIFSQVTTTLGGRLREFNEKICSVFQTRELERERAARQRRQKKSNDAGTGAAAASKNNGRKPKQFSLKTYKLHALGDYVSTIRRFGTTDSYSTQRVCLLSMFGCSQLMAIMIRANSSTERRRLVFFERMGDRYHCNCRRSNDGNAAFARSAEICIKRSQRISQMTLMRSTA